MSSVRMIPIDEIKVLNPRNRSKAKFTEIVANISSVGLKKPITVSRRGDGQRGYDLVCGQGRLEAYIQLGQTHVPALILDVPREERFVMSLIENIARRRTSPLDLAKQIMLLKERGHGTADVATKLAVSETYVRHVQRLFASGEERLLVAVARGEIPVSVAVMIAGSDDANTQKSLAEAYESGKLRGRALGRARALVDERKSRGKSMRGGSHRPRKGPSADEIVRRYQRETMRQRSLVRKAQTCEQRLAVIATGLGDLLRDESFRTLLRAEKLDEIPKYVAAQVKARSK